MSTCMFSTGQCGMNLDRAMSELIKFGKFKEKIYRSSAWAKLMTAAVILFFFYVILARGC